MSFALPAGMLIDMCLGRLRALVPLAPALAPLVDELRVLAETPTTADTGDRDHRRVDRLQTVLATVEVRIHAAAKASDHRRIAALSALVVTAFSDLDDVAARALLAKLETA